MDKALIDHATNLKIVARAGVGIDNVDVDAASSKGIIVVNAPYGNVNAAAEHTMQSCCRCAVMSRSPTAALKGAIGNVRLLQVVN